MRSDNKALSTVQDALGLGASKIDTAYTGMNKAIETVNEIKVKLVAANGASAADKEKIRHRNQGAAGPAEELRRRRHLLRRQLAVGRHDDAATPPPARFDDVKIVSSFNRDAAGTVSLGTIDVKVAGHQALRRRRRRDRPRRRHPRRRPPRHDRRPHAAASGRRTLGADAAGDTYTVVRSLSDGTRLHRRADHASMLTRGRSAR